MIPATVGGAGTVGMSTGGSKSSSSESSNKLPWPGTSGADEDQLLCLGCPHACDVADKGLVDRGDQRHL
jgi:hypothetical protein